MGELENEKMRKCANKKLKKFQKKMANEKIRNEKIRKLKKSN